MFARLVSCSLLAHQGFMPPFRPVRLVHEVRIPIEDGRSELSGRLTIPSPCRGIMIFAQGSESAPLNPRNLRVAEWLQKSGIGTLLFDLLTRIEGVTRAKVFAIELLASRLIQATNWLEKQPGINRLPIGYFGASTGAAAALWAASELGEKIVAVVSCGGRPELAMPR